ncbi:MAG: sulfotransferase [Gomphosphaeria aponina SAG 52.96 = DSM 107014]|uniref:Sulfotransferase n=1 Tax=Gomphosphaeria aponina SAG 52.96 = DSM 107014 TaxID=1521640 RepID=A0A941JLC0_9CHRO|nr:sulfotransferase [Gomphosphaeria aponina SAG 52.96 = DSM 107014]
MKPNYLVIGAAKSGTTTLCELLGRHPEVYMYFLKEVHFFDLYYNRGFKWYEAKFNPPAGVKAVGEGTPYADGNQKHLQRIAEYLPEAKLIYIVRHPIERIESNYVQLIDNNHDFTSLTNAIETCPKLVEASLYWARINDFWKYYPQDKILVLFVEDLYRDSLSVLKNCFDFLGVDSTVKIDNSSVQLNTRSQRATDIPLLRWLRKQPYFNDVKWALPYGLIQKVKPLLRKPIQKIDLTWEKSVREKVIAQVTEDTKQFLNFYGKPEDYWKF